MKCLMISYDRMSTMTVFQDHEEAERQHAEMLLAWGRWVRQEGIDPFYTVTLPYSMETYRLDLVIKVSLVEYNEECKRATIAIGVWGGQIANEVDRIVDRGSTFGG